MAKTRTKKGGMERGKFSLSKMREPLTQATDILHKSICKQNPDADLDDLETDVRQVVLKHGKGASSDAEVNSALRESAPAYNLAGDVLCLAYELFHEGQRKDAILALANALESDGIEELVAAIKETNSKTDIDALARASFESSSAFHSLLNDEENEEDEDEEGGALNTIEADDDYDDEDADEDDTPEGDDGSEEEEDAEDDTVMSSTDDEDADSDDEDEDENNAGDDDGLDEVVSEVNAELDLRDKNRRIALKKKARKRVEAEQLTESDESEDDNDNESHTDVQSPIVAGTKLTKEHAWLNKVSLSGKSRHRKVAQAIGKN